MAVITEHFFRKWCVGEIGTMLNICASCALTGRSGCRLVKFLIVPIAVPYVIPCPIIQCHRLMKYCLPAPVRW